MGERLRIFLILALLVPGLPAAGDSHVACWVERRFDPVLNEFMTVTRCRLAGGEVVDYASDDQVPVRLYPAVGTVSGNPCWYYTSSFTGMWIVIIYPNGEADIAVGNDPSEWVIIGLYVRCTAEPTPAPEPVRVVWDYVTDYIHSPPEPELSPQPGQGVTGLATFAAVPLPERHEARLTAGVTGLEVVVEVGSVVIHWGDGTTTTYPADPQQLSGYPEGAARHVYQRRLEAHLGVSYVWAVRWRPVGGVWVALAVPDTTTVIGYPVSEIVAVLD